MFLPSYVPFLVRMIPAAEIFSVSKGERVNIRTIRYHPPLACAIIPINPTSSKHSFQETSHSMENNNENQMKPVQFIKPIQGQPGPEWRDNETIVRSHTLKHYIRKQRFPLSVYNGQTESNHTPKGLEYYMGRYRLNPTQKAAKQTKRRRKKRQKQHAIDANV